MPSRSTLALLAFAVANLKVLPLAFHLRFYYYVLKNFYLHRARRPKSIFAPTRMHTITPLLELDFNLHKSNSTYFTDMDIARSDLLTSLFKRFYLEYSDPAAPKLKRHQWIYTPLGSVGLTFRKEIKPYTPYYVESRVLGWTSKWLFVLCVFRSGSTVHAYGISKYVMKQQRKTIAPETAIAYEGLLTDEAKAQNAEVQKYLEDSLELEDVINIVNRFSS